ncbi:hypothetical protein DFH08DRAFT_824850 [Mycena albidolilacea]|uniref:Uncharacterized protein n=1 Tax=Mycena albidolilacea TaxID=1033008 RepID=A0AAD6Z3W5_9AGAR|nr:hypothetical protein DFH08DRAFT_824850 [Mycena albidolilacea]
MPNAGGRVSVSRPPPPNIASTQHRIHPTSTSRRVREGVSGRGKDFEASRCGHGAAASAQEDGTGAPRAGEATRRILRWRTGTVGGAKIGGRSAERNRCRADSLRAEGAVQGRKVAGFENRTDLKPGSRRGVGESGVASGFATSTGNTPQMTDLSWLSPSRGMAVLGLQSQLPETIQNTVKHHGVQHEQGLIRRMASNSSRLTRRVRPASSSDLEWWGRGYASGQDSSGETWMMRRTRWSFATDTNETLDRGTSSHGMQVRFRETSPEHEVLLIWIWAHAATTF